MAGTFEQLRALARAHYDHDDERWRRTLLQIAAGLRSASAREELQKLTERTGMMQLIPAPSRDFVRPLPSVSLGSLVLGESVQAMLIEIVTEFRAAPVLRLRGVPPRSRLLFYGAPGCGKTSTAAALGGMVNASAYRMHMPAILESYLGATGKNLGRLFDVLASGCLIVMDEIDSIGTTRNAGQDGSGREWNAIVNTLLTAMDDTDHGFLIGTTNRIDLMDPAVLRRFDECIEFGAPTEDQAARLIEQLSIQYGLSSQPRCDGPGDRVSFDAITKAVQRVARQEIVVEWLAEEGRKAAEVPRNARSALPDAPAT